MAELLEESQGLESTTVGIYRTASVVKGGRRFSFSAMVVVGDRRGNVGIGYGKAGGVPVAIEKAQKDARKNMNRISLQAGTLPHAVEGKFGASSVRLIPAAPGTGVIAGGTVRAVLEMVGVQDCLTKAYGSTNQKNLCKAAIEGLKSLRMKEEVGALRGAEIASTKIDELLSAGLKYVPKRATDTPKAKGPVNNVGKKEAGGRGGNRRRRDSEQAPQAEAAAPAASAPTEQAPQ